LEGVNMAGRAATPICSIRKTLRCTGMFAPRRRYCWLF
jgi:hypothetical protein